MFINQNANKLGNFDLKTIFYKFYVIIINVITFTTRNEKILSMNICEFLVWLLRSRIIFARQCKFHFFVFSYTSLLAVPFHRSSRLFPFSFFMTRQKKKIVLFFFLCLRTPFRFFRLFSSIIHFSFYSLLSAREQGMLKTVDQKSTFLWTTYENSQINYIFMNLTHVLLQNLILRFDIFIIPIGENLVYMFEMQ